MVIYAFHGFPTVQGHMYICFSYIAIVSQLRILLCRCVIDECLVGVHQWSYLLSLFYGCCCIFCIVFEYVLNLS